MKQSSLERECDLCAEIFVGRGYRVELRGEGVSRYFCSAHCLKEWAAMTGPWNDSREVKAP